MSNRICQSRYLSYGSIICLGVVSSIGCLHGDFVFDDTEAIVNNKDVSSGPVSNILENDFWGTNLMHKNSHKSYRPLTVLTFRLNFWLHGRLVPSSFHIVNIVLHILTCLVLLHVYEVLLGLEKRNIALWASWIFTTHPIHTEAVCGIVGRADIMSALFFCLSFLTYASTVERSRFMCWMGILLSIVLAGLAMFSKEHGITVLGFNIVYDILVVQKITTKNLFKLNLIELKRIVYSRVLILLAAAAALVYLRCSLMGFNGPSFQAVDNPASFQQHWLFRMLSLHYIASLNMWLLLCPEWLCFDWSMGCVPLIQHLADIRIAATVICFAALIGFFLAIVNNSPSILQRGALLSFALIIVPFLPASNLLFRVGFVVAERILYIPSAGICLLVALGLDRLFTKKDVAVPFGLLLLIFIIKSHTRSLDWRSETSLFTSAINVCPNNAKVRYNIAKSRADRGDIDYAISEYREAIRLHPDYDQALNNLANLVKSRGELHEADKLLRRALKIRPEFPAAWMNLGIVLSGLKKYSQAEKSYLNALKLRKFYPDCYYNLGNLYLEQNLHSEAETAWRNALKLKPTMSVAWNNLIILKDNAGNHSQAVEIGKDALNSAGNESSFHFNIANALGKMSLFEEAESHFKKAVFLDPSNALCYVNLGVLYHRWHKYSLAETAYIAAIRLNPQLKSAKQNYEMLKDKLK